MLPDPGAAGSSTDTSGGAGSGATGMQGSAGDGDGGSDGGGGASAGSDGSAGEGGAAGMNGNAGGAGDGSAGSGGQAGGNSGQGGNDEPVEPGDAYTHCSDQEDCNVGLFCAAMQREGGSVGYCTSFCDVTTAASCAQPRTGSVVASCVPFASLCLLGTCDAADCPEGMRCVESGGGPFGGSGLLVCEYAVRDDQ